MNSKSLIAAAALTIAAANLPIYGVPIIFDLRDTNATAEVESGIINRGGITATLIPTVVGTNGVLNQTGNGFGINASGSDVSDQIDSNAGAESISISFNANVLLIGMQLSSFTTSEHASLTIAGFPNQSLTGTAPAADVYSFSANNTVLTGQTIVIAFNDGPFSFDSFTIERAPNSSAPDSLPFVFTACFLFGFLIISHRISAPRIPVTSRVNRR